jgi:uncharacterized protein YndB with AHSA1/START domain
MDIVLRAELNSFSRESVFAAMVEGSLLRLTGGSGSFELREGGAFRLDFEGRGRIDGTVLKLAPPETIVLVWNVAGFGRAAESATTVSIQLGQGRHSSSTVIVLEHRGLGSEESAVAKRRAWTEILETLEQSMRHFASEGPS